MPSRPTSAGSVGSAAVELPPIKAQAKVHPAFRVPPPLSPVRLDREERPHRAPLWYNATASGSFPPRPHLVVESSEPVLEVVPQGEIVVIAGAFDWVPPRGDLRWGWAPAVAGARPCIWCGRTLRVRDGETSLSPAVPAALFWTSSRAPRAVCRSPWRRTTRRTATRG